MDEQQAFFQEAFLRNFGLFSKKEQHRLRQSTVAVAGLGGVGGIEAIGLARLGVGGFHLADPDVFEVVNFNRQIGATMSTVGKSKVETITAMIRDINPFARITIWNEALDEENMGAFLSGADVVVDGIDFFLPHVRRLLYHESKKAGKFVVGAGPIGFGSASLVFDPRGMDFDTYFDIRDGMTEQEMILRFGIGLTPSLLQRSYFHPKSVDFEGKSGASLVTGTFCAAGLVLTNVTKVLLGYQVLTAPASLHFDPFVGKLRTPYLIFGNKGLLQRIKLAVVIWMLNRKKRHSSK